MKSTELRIGNLVYPFKDTISEIIGITNTHCFLKWGDDTLKATFDQVEPIPLTEEWLLKFGFKKVANWFVKTSWFHEDISISLYHNKTTIGSNEEYEIKHTEYVHDLQNLFHSFTGEELTYTPCQSQR